MAELDQVYGGISDNDQQMYQDEKQEFGSQPEYANSIQPQVNQQQNVQQPVQPMMQQMQQVQQMQPVQSKRQYIPSYSFWDRMVFKRNEVIKLGIFSLVILLAIALDKVVNYYLSKYLSENSLSDTQEFLIRLSYPIFIFLFIWITKSL